MLASGVAFSIRYQTRKRWTCGRTGRTSYPRSVLLLALLSLFAIATPVLAVTTRPLRLTPSCAAPDSQFLFEVNLLPRVYHRNVVHLVYFDWTGALSQPIYAENVPTWTPQWSHMIQVPHDATPGTHSIRFEQREVYDPPNSGQERTACVVNLHFQVALNAGPNPWRDSLKTSPNGDTVVVIFDPTGVCGIPSCDRIDLIQVVHATGRDSNAASRNLSFAEQGWRDSAARDSERTSAGFRVDVPSRATDPFYTRTGSMASFSGTPGRSSDSVAVAFLRDAPRRGDRSYPTDIVTIDLDFEVCAVCSQGNGLGERFGNYTWRWSRPRGGPYTITRFGGTRGAPSQAFDNALTLWRSRHPGFVLPVSSPPLVGGTPCP